jgi:pyruvate dehydrogenase E1 component alpha subunit
VAKVLPEEHELRRVIDEEREVDGLGPHDLLAIYRSLVLLRTYDERSVVYHRQGRIGTYAIFWNHEAMQAGSVHALADEDWIFPSYRESAIGLLRGIPASTVLHWWRGHPAGWWNPAEYRVASICVPIGTHVPHAAGLAWGEKLKGNSTVAIAYFGDGATSEGAFHEGANFAAVMQAPLILFCNNNQWAISTPLEAQTHAEALADKAVGYGMPGVRVDGGDVLAVYEDPRVYIDLDRVEEEKRNECLGRYDAYLRRLGVLDDATAEEIKNEALETMRQGIAAAEAEPEPDPELVFDNAYVLPPPTLREGWGG